MTVRDPLIRAQLLGLDEVGQELLDRVLRVQRKLDTRAAEIDALQAERRACVLGLTTRGVTKYRLHKILGVSQTTMANITAEREDEVIPTDG